METGRDALSGWARHAKKNARLIVVLGWVTVIAGILSLAAPLVSGLGITLLVGVAMSVGGVMRLAGAFHADSFGRGSLAFVGGVLGLVAGLILVMRPGFGLEILTLMLGAYLLADGIFGVILAFGVRPQRGWGSMLFSSALTLVLGFMLLAQWPLSGLWAIGALVGISIVFAGFSMIAIGSAARRLLERAG